MFAFLAVMKISICKPNPGLLLPVALAITFLINIEIGMPIYLLIVKS